MGQGYGSPAGASVGQLGSTCNCELCLRPVIFGESGTRDRLTTSHPDFDSPGDDAVFTRVVDDAQVTVMKGKCDGFLLTAIQVQDDRLTSAIDSLQELLSGPRCSTESRESESQYRTHEDFALRT